MCRRTTTPRIALQRAAAASTRLVIIDLGGGKWSIDVPGSECPPAVHPTVRALGHVCDLAKWGEPALRDAMRYEGTIPTGTSSAHHRSAISWAANWRED